MRGLTIPAGMIIQPGMNGYTPEFDARPSYDPDVARNLLAEAGRLPRWVRGQARLPANVGITVDCASMRRGVTDS
jgi:ABC-type transport system substrate-binding protein